MRRFNLYQRGTVFYCRFKDPDTGKWTSGISTGETEEKAALATVYGWERHGIPQRGERTVEAVTTARRLIDNLRTADVSRSEAKQIVDVLRERGFVVSYTLADSPGAEPFMDYLKRFWDYEKSPYVKHRKAYGHRISKKHCATMRYHVGNHYESFFGDVSLSEVTAEMLSEFALSLSGRVSEGSANHILRAGSTALRWAVKKGMITVDPTHGLELFPDNPKRRDILSPDEIRRLFAVEWPSDAARIASRVAMTTGMRAGEIAALTRSDIGEDRLHVRHSWSEVDGLTTPKNGETRTVPLLPAIRDELRRYADGSPHGAADDGFVFWSPDRADRPIGPKHFATGLNEALVLLSLPRAELEAANRARRARYRKAEVKDEDAAAAERVEADKARWRARGIAFHSWRHWYSKTMRDRVDRRILQIATGHKTAEMADHYADHEDPEYFAAVATAGRDAFSNIVAFDRDAG